MKVYVEHSKKLAYLLIPKNASSTFSNLFKGLGWEESQFDLMPSDYTVFSHLQDPIERHFKGTAEFIFQHKLSHLLEDKLWQHVWASSVMDIHSYPITWSLLNKTSVHWIPIHKNLNTNKITIDFLKKHGVQIDVIKNVINSHADKSIYYKRLLEIHKTLDAETNLSYFYDSDLVLWCKVLDDHIRNPEYRYE